MAIDVQELANRRYQQRNAVSVYSPTRPVLRQSGRTADAGTARRISGGGGGGGGYQQETATTPRFRIPGVTGSLPGFEYPTGSGPTQQMVGPGGGSRLDQLLGQTPAPQPEQAGGFLGSVVNSLPGRAIMGALNVLDYPRRVVISSVQEVADAFNGGDASFGDWVHQVQDPSFGFGNVVGSTGNIWADRLIGFTGDVLLDPLTYVAGSSAITGTGRTARVGGAVRAVAGGIDEDIAIRLGRYGYSALDNSERALLREAAKDTILDPGYYFKLPFVGDRMRIPGTGGMERAVSGVFGGARARMTASSLGQSMLGIRSPEGLEAAYRKVLTGAGDMPFNYATELINFRNAADRAGPAATARLNAMGQQLIQENGPDGLDAAMRQAEIDGTGPFAEYMNTAVELMGEYGMKLPRGPRQNFAPHIFTQQGAEWIRSGKTDEMAKAFKNVFYKEINLDETPSHLLQRELVPRFDSAGNPIPYDINGHQFVLRTGSIDEINAEFARLVPDAGFKLLDDNATSVIASYAKSLEDGIGVVAGIRALLDSKSGLVSTADDKSILKLTTDWAKTKLLSEDFASKLNTALRSLDDDVITTAAETSRRITSIQGVLGQRMRRTIDKLHSVLPQERQRLQQLLQEEQALTRQRGGRSMSGVFGRSAIEGSPGTPMKGKLEREFDRHIDQIDKKLSVVEAKLDALRDRAVAQQGKWEAIKREAMERGEIARTPRHLAAIREWQDLTAQAAQLKMDRESIDTLRARVIANDTRQAIVDARLGDDSFLFAAANRDRTRPQRIHSTTDPFFEPLASTAERRLIMPGNVDPGEVADLSLAQARTMFDQLTPEEKLMINEAVDREVASGARQVAAFKREVATHDALRRASQPRTADTLWRLKSDINQGLPHDYVTRVKYLRQEGEAQRLAVLGDSAGAIEMSTQINDQIDRIGTAENEAFRIYQRDDAKIESARLHLEEMHREEANLETMLRMAEGDPNPEARRMRAGVYDALAEHRSPTGGLGLANARYQDAGRELTQARKRLSVEENRLRELRERQFELANAENFGVQLGPAPPRLPYTPDEEVTIRRRHAEAIELREGWAATDEGQRAATIRRELDDIEGQLDGTRRGSVQAQIEAETNGLNKDFTIDRRGNVRPKDARANKVLRMVQQRDDLDAALDRAQRAGDAAAEADLQRQIDRANSRLARLKFDYPAHQRWTTQRNELSAALGRADEELAEATARANTDAILDPAARQDLRRLETAVRSRRDRLARQLDRHGARAEAHVRMSERQTRLSSLVEQRDGLRARGKELERQWRTVRETYEDLDTQVNYWSDKIETQQIAKRRAMVDERQHVPNPQAQKMKLDAIDRQVDERIERARAQRGNWERMQWEPVPPAAAQPVLPFTFVERYRMHKALTQIGNLQAGITEEGNRLTMQGARKAIRDIEDTLYPVSPQAAAEARGTLGEIEQNLAQIDAARQPWPYPPVGSATHKILLGGFDAAELRGGGMDLISRAKSARNVVDNMAGKEAGQGYEDLLVTAGAYVPGDFRYARDMSAELGRQLDFYAESPNPTTRSIINQMTRDLGVYGDVMWTAKRVVDAGEVQMDDRVMSFILARELYKESRVLDHRIKLQEALVANDTERWAAVAHERQILVHQAKIDHEESVMDELRQLKVREQRDFTPAEQREWSRAYKESKRQASQLEALQREGAPRLGLLDEDLDQIYSVVYKAFEDIDNATSDFNDARHIVADMNQPFRKREELEAYIPLAHGRLTQIRMSQEDLQQLIEEAAAAGRTSVEWNPWEMNVAPIDLSIEEAEEFIPNAPAWQRPELQRKLTAAKDRRARAQQMSSKIQRAESRITMAGPGRAPEAVRMTLDEARARLEQMGPAIANLSNSLKYWQMQLSVLDGSAGERLRVLRRKLDDEVRPPDPTRLEATNAELRARANIRPQERGPEGRFTSKLTPEEKVAYDLNAERAANIRKGGMDPDEYSNAVDEYELLTEVMDRYRAMHADQEDYIASVIDGGNKWFRDIVNGVRDPTTDDLLRLKELLGGEQGEYAETWIRTINNALAGRQPHGREVASSTSAMRAEDIVSPMRAGEIFREIAYTLGDTTLGERMAQRVAGVVTETGEMGEAAMQAMRDELYYSLVRTAQRERTERIHDLSQTLRDLGFEFFIEDRTAIPMPGVPAGKRRANLTLNEKMYTLGYQQGRQKFTPAKLRAFILERFEDMGYDIKRSLENQLDDLHMYSQRLDTMRRGLGAQVNMAHMDNPEEFFRIMRRAGELTSAEDLGNIASDADAFVRLSMPLSMEQAYELRMNALQDDLRDAIGRNDDEAINKAMLAIADHSEGAAAPAPPVAAPSLETPAAVAPPPAAPFDPEIEATRTRLTTERDQARNSAAQIEAQIRSLEMEGTIDHGTGAASANPLGELAQMAQAGGAPEGSFTQAQIEALGAELKRMMYANDPGQAQQRVLYTRAVTNHWRTEPVENVERAKALGAQYNATLTGESAAEAVVDNTSELARLRAQHSELTRAADEAQSQLDAVPARAATTEPPPPADVTAVPHAPDQPPDTEPSMLDAADESLAAEGYPAPEAAPGELPARLMDPSVSDAELSFDDIRYEHRMAVREFEDLSRDYGGFDNAPPEIQQRMGELSARARQLETMQSQITERAMRGDVDWDTYNRLRQPTPRARIFDWRHLVRHGTASVETTRTMMRGEMADAVVRMSGARPGLSGGRLFKGSLDSQEAAIRAQLRPMEALRDRLKAISQEAGAQSAADRATISGLEDQIAAGEQLIAATRERLTQEAAAPSPEYAAAVAGEGAEGVQIARQRTALQQRQAALQMHRLRREQQFTTALTQADIDLGRVRQAVVDTQRGVKSMELRRDEFAKALETTPTRDNARQLIGDLRDLNEWRRGRPEGAPIPVRMPGPTPTEAGYLGELDDIDIVESMLQEATLAANRLDMAQLGHDLVSTRLKQFADGSFKVAPVMREMIKEGWKPIAETSLQGPERTYIASGLANAIERVVRASEQPATWKMIDRFTSFFKTYATARPGFHVRNAISGVFMNLVDNVRLREIGAAPGTWKAFMDDPAVFFEGAKRQVLNERTGTTMADALNVVFGSGAGGQFMEYGVGTASEMSTKVFQRVMNNALTRFNRKAGSYVEGSLRLAMATDSLRKGMTPAAALDRVVKFHFNYNQVSRLDRTAKRFIPFWTFMSRNLPLQIEQMWLRPQMYLKYQSLVRNFSEKADPFTPEYWLAQGAFTMDPNAANEDSPWYLAPDLPHLRIAEPFEALAQGNLGKAILSDVNPLFTAPIEAYGFGKKLYTGAPIEENYTEPANAMKPLIPLFALLGATERGGTTGNILVDDRAQHVARTLLPPIDILERLTDTGGVRAGRTDETMLRSLGAPVYQLTPELRRSTARQRYYSGRDRVQTQAELARS